MQQPGRGSQSRFALRMVSQSASPSPLTSFQPGRVGRNWTRFADQLVVKLLYAIVLGFEHVWCGSGVVLDFVLQWMTFPWKFEPDISRYSL